MKEPWIIMLSFLVHTHLWEYIHKVSKPSLINSTPGGQVLLENSLTLDSVSGTKVGNIPALGYL